MGRPRKNRSEAANEETQELRGRLVPDRFLQMLSAYPDTAGTNIYINRLEPQIDRRLVGIQNKYIEKLTPPFFATWDYVVKMHGGGKYQVFFSDGKQDDARIANTIVEFSLVDQEPILNASELVRGNPQNEQLIQRWIAQGKVIQTEEGRIVNAPQGGMQGVDSKSVLQFAEKQIEAARHQGGSDSQVVDVIAAGAKKMVETAMEMNKPMGIGEITNIAAALRPQDNSAVMMQMFTAMLQQTQQQNTQMMQLFMQQQQQPKPENDVFGMIDRLTEKFGIAVPKKENSAADSLMELAKPLLPVAALWIMTKINTGKKEDAPAGRPQRRIAAPSGQQEQAAPQAQAAPADAKSEDQTLYDQTKRFALLVAHGIESGKAGWSLAERIDYDFGREVYDGIAGIGKEMIISTITTIPEAAPRLQDRKKLETFVDEFLNAFNDESQAEEADVEAVAAGS